MMQLLDPFGIWKKTRDATLDAWSQPMIDFAQSDEFVRFAGTFLDQALGLAQPVQDTVQKNMAYALAYLNMPTRDEIMSQAERLINIETRLDDLDAKTSDMRDEDRDRALTLEERLARLEERLAARAPDPNLDQVLNTLLTRLDGIEAAITAARPGMDPPGPPAGSEPEPKPPRRK
jgi:BMFP domain-containing protein YqiC